MCQVLSQSIDVLYPKKCLVGVILPPRPVRDYEVKTERTELSDAVNYKPFFKHYTYLYCFYLRGTKSFIHEIGPYFRFA